MSKQWRCAIVGSGVIGEWHARVISKLPNTTLVAMCDVAPDRAKAMLENLATTAIGEVKKNGMFVLPGIGRLVRVERKARMGRNPATGEAIKIAAKKVVKFRVAKSAKDAIVPPKKK